jgi:hypothetical protein
LTIASAGEYQGSSLVFTSGDNAGIWTKIASTAVSSGTITITGAALLSAPANNDTFQIGGRA